MEDDIQFVKVEDFKADTKKNFLNEECKKKVEETLKELSGKTNLLVEGTFSSPFKIRKVTPITPNFIKETLTI